MGKTLSFMALYPSGKEEVCKTFIVGSIPTSASKTVYGLSKYSQLILKPYAENETSLFICF